MDILYKFAIVAIEPIESQPTQFEAITIGYYVQVYRQGKFHHGVILITGDTELSNGKPVPVVSAIEVKKERGHVLQKVKKALGWDDNAYDRPHVCKILLRDETTLPSKVYEYLSKHYYY